MPDSVEYPHRCNRDPAHVPQRLDRLLQLVHRSQGMAITGFAPGRGGPADSQQRPARSPNFAWPELAAPMNPVPTSRRR